MAQTQADTVRATIIKMSKSYPLDKLSEWDRNPRINDEAVEAVSRSVAAFGGISPIIADKNGRICAGHTRYKAAREIGLKTFPVILVDFGSDESFKAYNVADNQTATIAEWDDLALSDLVIDLDESDFDVSLLGFDDERLQELLNGPEPELGEPVDAEPDDNAPAITQTGDLWQLGDHWLLCGDATKEADVVELMAGQKADMVFTDPPYDYESLGKGGAFAKQNDKVKADISHISKFDPAPFFAAIPSYCGGIYNGYIFCNRSLVPAYLNLAISKKLSFDILTWHKKTFIPNAGAHHYPDTEYIIFIKKGGTFNSGLSSEHYYKYFIEDKDAVVGHPTAKPLKIILLKVALSSKRGGIVSDPYLGSGSTLIACENLNRRCYAMEIDPHYCDVAVKRWEDATGNKAIRHPSGEPRDRGI